VAVGGYKAEAGCNGDLCGPTHEVPGLVPALAVQKAESDGDVKLSVGTGALVHHPFVYGKREAEAEADPAVVVAPTVYGSVLPYHAGVVPAVVSAPATQELTYKTITPTIDTNVVATNHAVPVAVGGYKAVAGDNGDLAGAVHEVPAIFGAPALNSQVNDASKGSLTVGTSAVVTHTVGEPIVKEHKVQVPVFGVYGKREAEADPYVVYGHGYGLYSGHGLYGLNGNIWGYPYFG